MPVRQVGGRDMNIVLVYADMNSFRAGHITH